jgi:class 3 adenylate cyclase
MRDRLKALGVRAAMTSAAAGGDLLFAEAARELGAAVHLVLPWSPDEFRRTSVRGFDAGRPDGPFWEPMFARALEQATTVRELGQMHEPSSTVGWDYTMEVTAGLALQTARVSRLDLQPVVLWDRQPVGGTYTFHKFWRDQLRQTPVCIDLPPIDGPVANAPAAPDAPPAPTAPATAERHAPADPDPADYAAADYAAASGDRCERRTMQQQVKSMLFADIVGYSKLTERVIPDFVATFMDRVSQLAAGSAHAPRSVNTWGDAVYGIFDFAEDAGQFALELTRMIQDNEKEWIARKLYWEEREPPAEPGGPERVRQVPLNVRVGLHTGPVFIHYDPVVRRLSFTGAHVNRAARIEPVTPPGEVYTSEEFAAMAELGTQIEQRRNVRTAGPIEEAEADDERAGQTFVCEYAGTMPLAKNYPGRFRIYRLLPKRVLALEELARAAHAAYRKAAEQATLEAASKGEKPPPQDARSLVTWDELSDDLKEANLAQVADIPVKLRMLGYELAPNAGLDPLEIRITPEQLEVLSRREHDRWADDRKRHGWTYAPTRDNAKKHHPCLVPWEDLPEVEKEKDRAVVRQLAEQVARAKFRVRKVG